MRVDHLSFAAGPDGLDATAQRLSEALGAEFTDGGIHPRFGTENKTMALAGGHYLEVVSVLDHPAADKAPFGQAVRARSELGGGWLGWVVRVDDLAPLEHRLGRQAVAGNRYLANGEQLEWLQLGVKGLQSDPQLPYFVKWLSEPVLHPAHGGDDSGVRLTKLDIAGDVKRVDEWIGGDTDETLADLIVTWVAPNGTPGIVAATFATPHGEVRI